MLVTFSTASWSLMSNVGYIKREGMCLSSTMRYRMRQREHIPRLYNEDADRQKKGKRWDELAEEFVNLALAVAGRGWKVGWKVGCKVGGWGGVHVCVGGWVAG